MMRTMYDPFSGNMYGFDDSVITGIIADSYYSKSEIDSKLAAVLRLCGQKDKFSDLPNTHEVGDVWIVLEDNSEYAWIKSGKWEKLGPVLDLSLYATKAYVDGLVGTVPSAYSNVVAYIAAVSEVANAALPKATYDAFLTTNSQEIAAAKKAGTDAASALESYKSSNNQALASVKSTADGALPASDFRTFESINAQNIAAAARVGASAQQSINDFETAQLVFESTAESIAALVDPTTKVETSDVYFSRRKTYYKLVGTEYVALVIGTDYDAMSPVADFGETVYESQGFAVTAIISKVNELVAAGNTLIAAHKAAAQEPEPEPQVVE